MEPQQCVRNGERFRGTAHLTPGIVKPGFEKIVPDLQRAGRTDDGNVRSRLPVSGFLVGPDRVDETVIKPAGSALFANDPVYARIFSYGLQRQQIEDEAGDQQSPRRDQ